MVGRKNLLHLVNPQAMSQSAQKMVSFNLICFFDEQPATFHIWIYAKIVIADQREKLTLD